VSICYRGGLVILLLLVLQSPACATSSPDSTTSEDQVCDASADYYLGMEDYPEAIERHRAVIDKHPDNALAHYHLGFAYGVMGQHQRELAEYQKAVSLGLDDWQLFLNLGLLYLENNQLRDASEVLRLSALLGPDHPEPHFNLALAYERLGMLEPAEQQMLLSLEIDPNQVDGHNTLGAIYAEEGKYMRAFDEWSGLVASNPEFTPARVNLNALKRVERTGLEGLSPQDGFAQRP
jgi:tetratricopeptide (TPR) repeat protein